LGIVLIIVFSVSLELLPSGGMYTIGRQFSVGDRLAHLVLPTGVLGLTMLAQISRYARASMVVVLRMDYVRTARAKGLAERIVLTRHALRNGMLPVLTAIGLLLPRLVGGAAIIETVFSWPGVGRLAVDAALARDYPVVMGITVVVSTTVILSNLLVDLAYPYLDPRVKLA
jgi:peptide/nickel transport system permease protein